MAKKDENKVKYSVLCTINGTIEVQIPSASNMKDALEAASQLKTSEVLDRGIWDDYGHHIYCVTESV